MLTLQQVYAIVFSIIGFILVSTACFVVARMIFPGIVSRGQQRFARRAWLPTVIGVGISVPWVVLSLVLVQQQAIPPLPAVGIVIYCAWVLVGLVGASSVAGHIGRESNGEIHPWKSTVRGGLALTLTWALPFIGWFFLLPLTFAIGVGCAVMGLFPIRAARAEHAARPRLRAPHDERIEQQLSGDLAFNDGRTS